MSLSKALLGAMNCPVCLEPPRKVPVPHCPNGHHVCRDCYVKIHVCPVCRDPRISSRSVLADAVIESMPLPCRFKTHGCLSNDMNMMERDLHEKTSCKYREVECPASICRVKVSLPRVLDHLKGHFKPNVILSDGEKWSLHLNGGLSGTRYWHSEHHVDEDDFVHKWIYKYGDWHWWVYFLGTREEAKKFKVQLDLENKLGDTASFMFSPISIDVPKDDVISRRLDLVMTHEFVQKFVDGNELTYRTTIIQRRSITVSDSGLPMSDSVQAGLTANSSDQASDPSDQAQNPPGLTEEVSGQAFDPPGQESH